MKNLVTIPTAFRKSWLVIALVMMLAGPNAAQAQTGPSLNFKRVINLWPTIELYFSVACDGQPAYFTDKTFFKVYENGVEVGEFTLWCPDPTSRCAISVTLVIDHSGSMSGGGLSGAQAAANAFIDMMDGVVDECGIIIFDNTVLAIVDPMTPDKTVLHNAINSIGVGGATSVWDGGYAGVQQVLTGSNPCRAVIILTDGGDNSSSHAWDDMVKLAVRNRIHIFTIGLGGFVDATYLAAIAAGTGGRYYEAPSPSQLVEIYREISTIIFQGFQECIITYQAKCMDGGLRTVDLSLLNFCNGNDTKTKTYRALKDTTTFIPITLTVGSVNTRGNTKVHIPIEMQEIFDKEILYPATFNIVFDENCAQFVDLTTKGTLLDGVPVTLTPFAGGITVETKDKIILNGTGKLFDLTFKASDPDGKDTVCCPIEIQNWKFSAGCRKPVLKPGKICIIPRQPNVICTINMARELQWVKQLKDYTPNPFTMSITLSNNGDREARNARLKITYKPADLSLVAPTSSVQNTTPRDVLPAGMAEGRWDLMAKRRLTGDSVEVCVTASFDNHKDITCCAKVWVPPADAVLSCTVSAPTIVADQVNLRYTPMPFNIDVLATNEGGRKTDTVWATIVIPSGQLKLAGVDAPDKNTKKILPFILNPGQTGGCSFTLTHPITLKPLNYTIGVWVKTSNADSSYCTVDILIPELFAPILSPSCTTPDSLHFDEPSDSYVPNPFDVTLKTINVGGLPATDVGAFLYLPDGVVFTTPGDDGVRKYSPSTLNQYSGGPMPEVSWNVRYTKKLRYNQTLKFRFIVGGMGPTGLPLDSTDTWCYVKVPGLAPSFKCDLTLPDSLAMNAAETGVEPNPFQIVYRVWNTSRQTAKISTVVLYMPTGEGITLDASTPQATLTPNKTLTPGDTATYIWILNVQNRITRRNPYFQVVAYDDDGNPVPCDRQLPIANLKTSLLCDAKASLGTINYIPVTREYDSTRWHVDFTLTNTGGAPLDNVVVNLTVTDPSGQDLVELDPNFVPADGGDNMILSRTIPVLFTNTARTLQWGFHLKNFNTTGLSQFINFSVSYKSDQTPEITGACDAGVLIRPVVTPAIECALQAPDSINFVIDKYIPTPFDLRIRVRNTGDGDAYHVKAYVLQDTRFNILPPAIHDFGQVNAMTTLDFNTNDPFQLRVNPRETDGYDTVRVSLIADGLPPSYCEYPIWVQHEQRPVFQMNCVANPNTLVFDDQMNDYIPNPFQLTTTAINVGETEATNCQLVFVGPPRFTPVDASPIYDVPGGTMRVNDTVTHTWNLRALRRTTGGWDTLVYQIQGRGGMGQRLIIGECRVPVYVPAARSAEYQMICTAPAKLVFDNSNGVYVPDPFTFKATVTNGGQALGRGLQVTAMLPPGVIFATGETSTKWIGDLAPGASVDVQWLIRPVAIPAGQPSLTVTMCAEVKDTLGKTGSCCSKVEIPPATRALLDLACQSVPSTLVVDKQEGRYATNPFIGKIKITNNGQSPADSVKVVLLPQSQRVKVVTPSTPEKFVALRLDPGVSTSDLTWDLYATPKNIDETVELRFVVTAKDMPSQVCVAYVIVPAVEPPDVHCNMFASLTKTNDTLKFDYSFGDYMDDLQSRSSTNRYNTFKISTAISNNQGADAKNVEASLLMPPGVSFDEGETPVKTVGTIKAGQAVTVSWMLKPERTPVTTPIQFSTLVTSTNTIIDPCVKDVVIEGAPKTEQVRLPKDAVGTYGDKIHVPVYIEPTIGKNIYQYKINVKFDPTVVAFVEAYSEGTLTGRGWNGPVARVLKNKATGIEDVLRVEDRTTGASLSEHDGGYLVVLVFEAVYGGGNTTTRLQTAVSALEIKSVQTFVAVMKDRNGNDVDSTLVSSMNSSMDDDAGRDVMFVPEEDGLVTVSGECIQPLLSTGTALKQNTPNPFNPSTRIEYSLGAASHVRLTVYDALGRPVRTLVDADEKAGAHAVVFDAANLPSGTYLYRLETPTYTRMLKMVLAR